MENPIQTPPVGTEVVEPVTPTIDPAPEAADPEPQIEEPTAPTGDEPEAPETPAPAAPQPPTVEERYRQSSSEAMILNSKNKNLESTLNKITSEDTPIEAEITAAYPDYATYNAVTQQLMRDNLANRKMNQRILRQQAEDEAERGWQADLKAITRKPEYSSLKGDDKFEEFVFQPKHKGVDIAVLADAYLVRTGKVGPPVEPNEPKPAPQPKSGLPRGAGGPRGSAKPAKIPIEQAKVLRETNYKEYTRQLKAGNIESEV